MNTELYYMYRDAANYKTSRRIVLEGEFTGEDLALIGSKLDDGTHFIPSQVGLDDLQEGLTVYTGGEMTEDDHVWHEWGEVSYGVPVEKSVTLTEKAPTAPISWAELVENFRRLEDWDVEGAVLALGIPAE